MFRRLARDTSVSFRLFVASISPIVAMIGLAAFLMMHQVQIAQDMRGARDLVHFATITSNLVHELQKERGMSAVFLNGVGQQMTQELLHQRQLSSDQLVAVRDAMAVLDLNAYPATISQRIVAAMNTTQALDAKRAEIADRRLKGTASFQFYTGLIDQLLAVPQEAVRSSSDPALTTTLLAYNGFINGKERAGRERAFAALGFATGRFDAEQYRNLVKVISEQEVS